MRQVDKTQPVICNFNFHTSIGGTQRSLGSLLPLLARHYCLRVIDPYRNDSFKQLMEEKGLAVEPVVDLSERTRLSQASGYRRYLDYTLASPTYIAFAFTLRQYLGRNGIDVVYTDQNKSALVAVLAASRRQRVVFHCHDAGTSGIRVVKAIQGRLAMVIANSEYTRTALESLGFCSQKIVVVNNIIDLTDGDAGVGQRAANFPVAVPGRSVVLVAHSGIDPNKGTMVAVEAFGRILKSGIESELWITGDTAPAQMGYFEEVNQRIRLLGIKDRVRFLGRRDDVFALMHAADVVAMPTVFREHFGRSAAEAMGLGRAVVVSDVGALSDLVDDGITGIRVKPGCPDALASALTTFLTQANFRMKCGDAARKSIGERFSSACAEVAITRAMFQLGVKSNI